MEDEDIINETSERLGINYDILDKIYKMGIEKETQQPYQDKFIATIKIVEDGKVFEFQFVKKIKDK